MFRGKFCAGLLKLRVAGQLQFHGQLQPFVQASVWADLLRKIQSQRWNVFAKGSVVGPESVLEYLGRYPHRVAISNGRLLNLDPTGRTVTFRYKDYVLRARVPP
jgi:hypothetical protein